MPRILVVEDSLTIISVVESQLRKSGHKVYLARNGLTALAAVRAFTPDLMLLDIMLPHTDGFGVCNAIRQKKLYDPMPIIMMTGLTDENSIERAYREGANGYLTKPVSEEELRLCVEQHLARAQMQAPHTWEVQNASFSINA